jgi:hypothetical protein
MPGKLEMSALRAVIFQSRVFPELVWRQMLSLQPSEMGGVGKRYPYFSAPIPVWLEG